jgi:hypothetical protein
VVVVDDWRDEKEKCGGEFMADAKRQKKGWNECKVCGMERKKKCIRREKENARRVVAIRIKTRPRKKKRKRVQRAKRKLTVCGSKPSFWVPLFYGSGSEPRRRSIQRLAVKVVEVADGGDELLGKSECIDDLSLQEQKIVRDVGLNVYRVVLQFFAESIRFWRRWRLGTKPTVGGRIQILALFNVTG